MCGPHLWSICCCKGALQQVWANKRAGKSLNEVAWKSTREKLGSSLEVAHFTKKEVKLREKQWQKLAWDQHYYNDLVYLFNCLCLCHQVPAIIPQKQQLYLHQDRMSFQSLSALREPWVSQLIKTLILTSSRALIKGSSSQEPLLVGHFDLLT